MSVDIRRFLTGAVIAAGAVLAVTVPATAAAEPVPIPPGPLVPDPAAPIPPAPDAPIVAAAAPVPDGTPHLASPDALPPGSTMDPAISRDETPNVSYLKDLWHAVQNQEISGKEALILGLAQRGMNTPYPDQAPGPNVPVGAAPVGPALTPPAQAGPLIPAPPAA